MKENNSNKIIYGISRESLQEEAQNRIGRELNDDEIRTAKKCIECGLNTGIDTVFSAAIQEAVSINTIQ
jgi:hypothetical protein